MESKENRKKERGPVGKALHALGSVWRGYRWFYRGRPWYVKLLSAIVTNRLPLREASVGDAASAFLARSVRQMIETGETQA